MFLTQPKPKFRSVFSTAALVVLSACTVFATPPGCTTIANKGFTVAAFVSGRLLQQTFNGTTIDLLALHEVAIRNDSGLFNGQSSLLLLSYNDDVIELSYNVKFVALSARTGAFFSDEEMDLTSITVSNFNAPGTSNNSIPAAFGKVDLSTVTLFQDVVFGNGKMFNITSKTFVDTIDERISYAPGSHFDLENPISVAGSNVSGTLIGVVSGKLIYREPCEHHQETSFLVDCTKQCQKARKDTSASSWTAAKSHMDPRRSSRRSPLSLPLPSTSPRYRHCRPPPRPLPPPRRLRLTPCSPRWTPPLKSPPFPPPSRLSRPATSTTARRTTTRSPTTTSRGRTWPKRTAIGTKCGGTTC
ncbi:hypothetical protein L596_013627 [Steinernema carpocapsae]|uniref:Uncharacterized protein n=1 Tax=Steinernema carpocapsae TaxID=34508 RepID=A0A4U5P1E2_STECR|nr:hypothetical protein L596_013627 [Steinernema carpocapsae]